MSVFKLGKSWYYIVDIGIDPHTGKRKQEKKGGFKKQIDAKLAEGKIVEQVKNGTYVRESNTTFKEFADEWMELYGDDAKESTRHKRQYEVNRLIKYFGALTKIKDITPKKYQKMLSSLNKEGKTLGKEKSGYSKNTLGGIHATARMIFRKALEFRIIKADPTEFAKIPKEKITVEQLEQETDIPKYLEKDQLSLFLETARMKGLKNDYAAFVTLAYTGMRVGELCVLKESDVDVSESTISITKTQHNPNSNIKKSELLTPKTTKSKRIIEVDTMVIKEIEKLLSKQNVVKMRHRDIYHLPDKGYIFTVDKYPGYPIYTKLVESRMRRLLKLAGLDDSFTPHSLRHTHTSLLAEAGVSLEEIMDRLGHTDCNTTKKIYLHVTKTKKKEASQKFAELMKNL